MKIIRDNKEIELTSEEVWEAYNEVRRRNYRDYIEDRLSGEWQYEHLDQTGKAKVLDELTAQMLDYLYQHDCSDESAYNAVCEDFLDEIFVMKIRDFLKLEVDIDVMGNIAVAFCGPLELTPEGIEHFSDILDLEIEVGPSEAYVNASNSRLYDKAKELFWSAAGYCSDTTWSKYFKEDD